MEKRDFSATIIVAGTKSAKRAAKVEETVSPIPIPIRDPLTESIPNLLTTTNIAPVIKKFWTSFPETLIENPTIIPKITKIA